MKKDTLFNTRLQPCLEELQSLFFSLYGKNREAFSYFLGMLERSLTQRKPALRRLDQKRLSNPEWCRSSRMMGMMLYPSCFAGTLRGVQEKLPYLKGCGLNAAASETGEPGVVEVRFPDVPGIPDGFDELKKILEDILPSHLEIQYKFWYITWALMEERFDTWGDVEAISPTWEELEDRFVTWGELEELNLTWHEVEKLVT